MKVKHMESALAVIAGISMGNAIFDDLRACAIGLCICVFIIGGMMISLDCKK